MSTNDIYKLINPDRNFKFVRRNKSEFVGLLVDPYTHQQVLICRLIFLEEECIRRLKS